MSKQQQLSRELGLGGAIFMGLGSILGTGVFVSLSIAAGIAGPLTLLAILAAALLAICNGLSSAQLAANHPVSGGTYEYGYHFLHPVFGFSAGWMFLCAKSASAATAALGFASYLLGNFIYPIPSFLTVAVASGVVVVMTLVVLGGIRRSHWVNSCIVSVTLLALLVFIVVGGLSFPVAYQENLVALSSADSPTASDFLGATALVFVAYTGYGRIATLGEEVKSPGITIPRAVIFTLLLSMALYFAVALVSIAHVGAASFGKLQQQAPLEIIARDFPLPFAAQIMSLGAITAMLGVLLNLLLGLSRVVLAMGRREDFPRLFARLDQTGKTPYPAVLATGVMIFLLTLIGDIKTTWSFSAFTVLIYYAITNLAALRLSAQERYYPRIVPVIGFLSCLFLAFWIEIYIVLAGVALLLVGLVFHLVRKRQVIRKINVSVSEGKWEK